MNSKQFKFDHVGIAVTSLEEAAGFYRNLGFGEGHRESVEGEKVNVQMYELGNDCRVELLEPSSPESVIAKFLASRGPGVHHICFRVENLAERLVELKRSGVRLIHETPITGAGGCKVAFIHPKSAGGVLIELSEKPD